MTRSAVAALLLASVVAFAGEPDGHVGIIVGDDFRVVTAVWPNSPAERAGVLVGDRIVTIDGHSTAALEKAQFVKTASGPIGSAVQLELQRDGTDGVVRLRLYRVARPTSFPSQIPPGFDARQADNCVERPNQRCS